jgi:hypothetical protein
LFFIGADLAPGDISRSLALTATAKTFALMGKWQYDFSFSETKNELLALW